MENLLVAGPLLQGLYPSLDLRQHRDSGTQNGSLPEVSFASWLMFRVSTIARPSFGYQSWPGKWASTIFQMKFPRLNQPTPSPHAGSRACPSALPHHHGAHLVFTRPHSPGLILCLSRWPPPVGAGWPLSKRAPLFPEHSSHLPPRLSPPPGPSCKFHKYRFPY